MSQESSGGLIRELGLTEAIAIGLGAMGGAGIFVLASLALGQVGPGAVFSFVLAGLVCLPTTLAMSELATGMGRAGGSYALITSALGPLAGSVVGPGNWLGLTIAAAFFLIALSDYLAATFSIPAWATTLVVGAGLTYVNFRGAKASGSLQNLVVFSFVGILLVFSFDGLFHVKPALYQPLFPKGVGSAVVMVGLVIVSHTGFEKISTLVEEIRNPRRNIPIAIIGVVLIAIALYALVLIVTAGLLSRSAIANSQTPLVDAATVAAGSVGKWAMLVAGLLATTSSVNAAIIASSRINLAMGRDRILPGWFDWIHPRYLAPGRSIVVTGALAILLALTHQVAILAEVSSALFMLSYALVSLSLIVMRRTKPEWYRPSFRVPLYPVLPLLGGLLSLAVIGLMSHISQLAGLGLVALSLGWYAAWGRRNAEVKGEFPKWMEREKPVEAVVARAEEAAEGERHTILVAVSNPETAHDLGQLAAALAQARPGTIVAAARITPVPLNLSLASAEWYMQQRESDKNRDLVEQAAAPSEERGVPVDKLVRAAHGIASGIVELARSRPDTRLILLGWRGALTLSHIRTSIVNDVIRTAPFDVATLIRRGDQEIKRILVPTTGGPHSRLGLRLGADLAVGDGAELVALRVVQDPDADLDELEEGLEEMIKSELEDGAGRATARVVQSLDVMGGILNEVRQGYDLLIVGASEEWSLQSWLFGALPDRIAQRAPCSVLLVRKYEPPAVSWLRRLFKRVRERDGS